MAYSITNLHHHSIKDKQYIFDSNMWIFILRPKLKPTRIEKDYLTFFSRFKVHEKKPKIILLSTILSEVINTLLKIACEAYASRSNITLDKYYFKQKYRYTEDYKESYHTICDDIKNFGKLYELKSDDFGSNIKVEDILNSPLIGLDFNDLIIYQIAKANGYIIITNDSDFYVEDVEVLTYNTTLLNK